MANGQHQLCIYFTCSVSLVALVCSCTTPPFNCQSSGLTSPAAVLVALLPVAVRSCIVDTIAVVDYFEFGRPFTTTVGILLGYLGVMHVLTYIAMVLSARKEAR
eukprot:GHRQ01034440.1.p1 GENE.GHRQ01034440.1~~GHRQ01034440.1.p1  ORF type:complete len:104 (-),score=42.62 GHRQ01034440.1:435-746(-)